MEKVRLPRFKRSAAIAPLRLTERDRKTINHVRRHRFLRSNHLTALLPGSRQKIIRRLQRLYHHGYLERPGCQIDYYRSGSRRMAYGIGNKGAWLLKHELSIPFHRLSLERPDKIGRLFLEHALLISDFMVALELACRSRADVRLITPDDIDSSTNKRGRREKFRWTVNLGRGTACGIVPDRVFGLEFTDGAGQKPQTWFFLEADRGTMPVIRSGLDQSSFYRKLLAYAAMWSQNIHRSRFGWQRFRVLTITTDKGRLATMQRASQRLQHGKGLFLFADVKSLQSHSDVLAFPWQTHSPGESACLKG